MTNPLRDKEIPVVGDMVLYRHDAGIFPALVLARRVRGLVAGKEGLFNEGNVLLDEPRVVDPVVQLHLAIFRPGVTEWRWATRGDQSHQWMVRGGYIEQ